MYNVLRHVIITLVLLIIICTWHYVTIKLLLLLSDLHKVDKTALVTINGAVSMLTKAWLKYRTFIVAIAHAEKTRNAYKLQYEATMRPTVSKYTHLSVC